MPTPTLTIDLTKLDPSTLSGFVILLNRDLDTLDQCSLSIPEPDFIETRATIHAYRTVILNHLNAMGHYTNNLEQRELHELLSRSGA